MTIVDLETLRALESLSVEVKVAGGLRRGEFISTLRRRAIAKLNTLALPYAVDLTEDAVIYQVVPGPADAWGCLRYRCRWEPQPGPAELAGGPKDGQSLQLVSHRTEIQFQMLAPDWKEAAAANPGGFVPKVLYTYRLAGYNLATKAFVFRCGDPVRID